MNEAYVNIVGKLGEPFDVRDVEFRVGQGGKILAYVDLRAYVDRLHRDAPGQWAITNYREVGEGENAHPHLTLEIAGVPMIAVTDPEKPTSAYAKVFKRACSLHQLGSYLYSLPNTPGARVENKIVVTNHLSIAIWIYEQMGYDIPAEAYTELERVPASERYNPNARPAPRPAPAPANGPQRPTQRSAGSQQSAQQDGLLTETSNNPHKGKLTWKQVNVLLKAGLNHGHINQMDTQSARAAVSDVVNGSSADDIIQTYISDSVELATNPW